MCFGEAFLVDFLDSTSKLIVLLDWTKSSIISNTHHAQNSPPPHHLSSDHRLRVAPPISLPVAAPPWEDSTSVPGAAAAGLLPVPAIHPARSKLPGAAPPPMAPLAAPDTGEARDCFSNSARISGSTVDRLVWELPRDIYIYIYIYIIPKIPKKRKRTILHQLGHPKSKPQGDQREQNHRVLEKSQGGDYNQSNAFHG